jgi:sulfate transport system ATP-binding protein
MDISDQIVVINHGKVEQTGTPRELYEQPVNQFVMTFVGEVNELGDELVRPHDLEILTTPNGSTQEGLIDRLVHLGFEVRVELTLEDGRAVWVQLTRQRADELELHEGQIVYVRKEGVRRFEGAGA